MSTIFDAAKNAAAIVLARYVPVTVVSVEVGWYSESVETGFESDVESAKDAFEGLCDAISDWVGQGVNMKFTFDPNTSGRTPSPSVATSAYETHAELSEAVRQASGEAWVASSEEFGKIRSARPTSMQVVLDNGGGITLQVVDGDWEGIFDFAGSPASLVESIQDLVEDPGCARSWDNNQSDEGTKLIEPSDDDIRSNGYRIVDFDTVTEFIYGVREVKEWGRNAEQLWVEILKHFVLEDW